MPINDLEQSSGQNQKKTPREELVEDLAEKLIENRFVAVSGPEGSGKSTLVSELLLNQLSSNENKTEKDNFKWRITFTSPDASPISNLINSIKEIKENRGKMPSLFKKNSFTFNDPLFSPENFRNNPDILTEIYHKAYGEIQKTFHWLIVIDQSQDLFRYRGFWNGAGGNTSSQSAKTGDDVIYLNLMLNARRSAVPIFIVFIFDYQYIELYSRYRGIPEAINNSRVYVPHFTEKEVDVFLKSKELDNDEDFIEHIKTDTHTIINDYDGYVLLKLNIFLELFRLAQQKLEEAQMEFEKAERELEQAQKEAKEAKKKLEEAKKKFEEAQKKLEEAKKEATLRGLYQTIGAFQTRHPASCPPLQKIIAYYLEKELGIHSFNDKEKFFLQALTRLDSDNRPQCNPLKMSDLLNFVNRDEPQIKKFIKNQPRSSNAKEEKPWGKDEIEKFLQKFKNSDLSFRNLSINDGKNDCIIDIKDKALLTSWPELRRLVDQEAEDAQLYRNLVRYAIQYYSNADESLLYKEAAFENTLMWLKRCRPNETWCLRYYSEYLADDTKEAIRGHEDFKNEAVDKFTHFSLALKFFEKSNEQFEKLNEEEDSKLKRAKRRACRALVLALLCLIFGLGTTWAILDIKKEKKKIEAREFINTLFFYSVLKFSSDLYKQRNQLSQIWEFVDKGKKIKDEIILDTLRNRKYLSIGSENPDIIISSYQVLKTLKQVNTKFEKGKENLLAIYEQFNQFKPAQFRQFPAFYQALNAYYWELAPYDETEYTMVDPEALVALKKYNGYCFGDREGKIHYVSEAGDQKSPIEVQLSPPKFPISCLDFSPEVLFFGNYGGEIYELPLTRIMQPGLAAKDNRIYGEAKTPIVLLKTLPDQANSLFVVSSLAYYTLRKNNQGKWLKYKQFDKDALSLMAHYEWYADESMLFYILKNSVFVYKVTSDGMKQIGTYTMDSSPFIITSVAIQKKKDKSSKSSNFYEVAIGDEKGNVWIGEGERENHQHGEIMFKNFTKFSRAHTAPITRLAFNPELPQLASADLNGSLKFWNLNTLHNQAPNFDDVFLSYGDKINAIAYLDKNRLVVHSGNNHFIEPTNIEYMYTYLKRFK